MYLERVKSPEDLKKLSIDELQQLAEELRSRILEQVSKGGGHLSSNLGVIELTIALHYVFSSPQDKIVWDVGHQSYAHKLLTGRADAFDTLRRFGGLSGFPKRSESEHDAFGTGHSATSISAALGMAEARDLRGEEFKVVAVIGDGALTGGLAFEGLNQAGHRKKDMIVILNDNEMSISPNVGAMSAYLHRVLTGSFFSRVRKETKAILEGIPKIGESVAKIAHRAEGSLKGFFLPGGLFVDLGFEYLGPIDGHDIALLIETLRNIKDIREPIILHIVTRKGKGYKYSEEDPCVFHGVGPFAVDTGEQRSALKPADQPAVCQQTYCEAFGLALTELASSDDRIVAITAAMTEGTGLAPFAEKHPKRFYDVGIAEQHAVTFAAGLAASGLRPVVAVYSTFLQRAYDQIIHDVCLQNLPVVFAIDRAGIVGEDGPTHHGLFDISFLRCVPNLLVMAPKDLQELKRMLSFALKHDGPVAIRYPRGRAGLDLSYLFHEFDLKTGKAEVLAEGDDIAIIAVGHSVPPALKAADELRRSGVHATVVNARFVKPLDAGLIVSLGEKTKRILTVEENALAGGFGASVLETLAQAGMQSVFVKCLGVPDTFIPHGSQKRLREMNGLDEGGIYQAAMALIAESRIRLARSDQ
ncbi:MAG TPA: 1-deoxy-D-xylulose-5-phosphate synthase [Dissulfurispiraceae bacterium]|nr:1-deoxy-D-xylulose-5-phosphate synthase [Dissulfurispiraceae bacterium]